MKLKTRGKLLLLIISAILLFSIVVNLIIYFQFNSYITNSTLKTNSKLTLQLINEKYSGDWKIENEKLYKGNKLINDDFEIVDTIKKSADVECTIFLKDTRISTTIIKSGSRATGTKADDVVLKKVLNEGSEYMGSVNILDTPYKTIYLPIKSVDGSTIGMFFIGIQQQMINKEISTFIFPIIIFTIILLATITVFIVLLTTKLIINPLTYVKKQLQLISAGDLSVDIKQNYLNKKDEFGEIAVSIKIMQDSIKEIIMEIHESTNSTDNESSSLAAISEEMSSSAANVTSAIQDIAKGVDLQTGSLIQVSSTLDHFGKSLGIIMKSIENIDNNTKGISSMANDSNHDMFKLSESVNSFSDSFKEFMVKIKSLGDSINHINEITSLINNIADQTNLLALNAAIEAARAGEAGRGFSVVADEIRKLAEQTKFSSEEITKLIESVNTNTTEMIDKTSVEMDSQLNNQISVINTSMNSFKHIIDGVNEVLPKMSEVALSTQHINKDKDNILEKIDEISSISQEVSASFQEITASAEEMSSSTEEVATVAQNLNIRTKEILTHVDKFKLK